MSQYEELIKNEIQLAEDECCIVFDFACYFPYANPEVLKFEFSLGMEEFNDFKLNHRYPNKDFLTISKKYGRKLSKLGYPVVMKLEEQGPLMLLCLKIGIQDHWEGTLVFLLQTNMTKEKPVCALSLNFNFDEARFFFDSYEKSENGWYVHRWNNRKPKVDLPAPFREIILRNPEIIEGSNTAVYQDLITPYALSLTDLCVDCFV